MREKTYQIRDPLHGTLHLSKPEIRVVDELAYQRLRHIKQLGLADLAYPGATHTRYIHGLGTQHVAARMFDFLMRDVEIEAADERRLRQTLRLAALFHDLGHAPLSHTTERFMPPAEALDLGVWAKGPAGRRASHEDYTLAILTRSHLTETIEAAFGDLGVTASEIAAVLCGDGPAEVQAAFQVGGRNWLPLLVQCVSSELDADRMDYLLRDSHYAGVPYGRYDLEWLLENLVPVDRDGAMYLGLAARATYGFEDYLLSRHNMFMAVYLNHIPIAYEAMLARYHEDAPEELTLPADPEAYLACDDIFLVQRLRSSKSEWARRMVTRRAYRMVLEVRDDPGGGQGVSAKVDLPDRGAPDVRQMQDRLQSAGLRALTYTVKGSLSKYFNPGGSAPPATGRVPDLFIVEAGRAFPVEEYVPVYRRYAGEVKLERLYVDPEDLDAAKALLRAR